MFDWFCCNHLTLSEPKTKGIIFARQLNDLPNLIQNIKISINKTPISIENNVKLLGHIIDSTLSWDCHVKHIISKLSSSIYAMNSCKHILNTELLKLMYYGFMYPHLQYGIVLWGGMISGAHKKRLLSFQRRALKCILSRTTCKRGTDLFTLGNILDIDNLTKLAFLKIAYRSERQLLPTTIQSFFTQNNSVHRHNTRNRYHIPRYKYKSIKNSFIYQSPHLWNSVPLDIRSSTWGKILAWFRGRGSLG